MGDFIFIIDPDSDTGPDTDTGIDPNSDTVPNRTDFFQYRYPTLKIGTHFDQ